MPMNPRLLRPLASGRFAAIAKDSSGNVIAPVLYADGGENYVAHIFNTSGTLEFLRAVDVEYLIVAGGGGGGSDTNSTGTGGGGAGGLVTNAGSPLATSAGIKSVVVGAGGARRDAGTRTAGFDGSDSSVFSVSATGGGGGGSGVFFGRSGGSGGGGGAGNSSFLTAGTGIAGQGNAGGDGVSGASVGSRAGGGGGGAGQAGANGATGAGGDGGDGLSSTLSGQEVFYAGGGGGGAGSGTEGAGGVGGGANSGTGAGGGGADAAPNTGGGGGGTGNGGAGGAGGSGIVIVRYKRTAAALNYDPDAFAYIEAVQSADNAGLEPAVRDAINDFVIGCKQDGIWGAIKASCILMGARTLSGALTPLVGAAPTNNNFAPGDYDRKTGLVGDGATTFLDSNRAGDADTQNDCSLWVFPSQISGTGAHLGNTISAGTAGQVMLFGGTTLNHRLKTGTQTSSTVSANNLIGMSRSSSSEYLFRGDGTTSTIAVASDGNISANVRIFSRVGVHFSAHRLVAYGLGSSIDLALLDARVSTLYNAIGAAIP